MRLQRSIIACAALAAIGLPASAQAATAFQNGSFEASLAGWTVNSAFVVTPMIFNHDDHAGGFTQYDPVDGSTFASLAADQPTEAVTLSQTFTTTGGVFSGWAAFSASDTAEFNDSSFVKLFNGATTIWLFSKDIAGVGDYGQTGWKSFSTVLTAGEWTIEASVLNDQDDFGPSHLLLDNFAMAEVPEPATWALMLMGFFGLGGAIRQRRAAICA